MKIMTLIFCLIFTTSLFAARKSDDDLNFKIAQQRKEQVESVSYDLFFELDKNVSGFSGKTVISAKLRQWKNPLTIDSMVKKLKTVKVNGKVLSNFTQRLGSFDIPVSHLTSNVVIEIDYSSDYSNTAGGFIRSRDPEDGSEYVYTDFEPYSAHKLFPCIDQPDLKARFSVSVLAPLDWLVIQNELIKSVEKKGVKNLTHFQTTPFISTYLFFLGAGPFYEWSESYGDLPLKLYARKSLKKYVDAEKIFSTTKKGLKFFNDYFGYPYPFSKYGQIFIPEFAWGGMENPGAVTLNERMIFRGPVPASMISKRDNLILHEMAHMWFGDLVTMEWWNDLWLNESFATYLSSVAQERGMKDEGTWLNFFNTKTWGYWQDQLVTTHPIETEVPDVRTAKGNFDGITYAKGASALKQLHFYVGEEGFREGLRSYFKEFAFKNTQRKDFIDAIAKASKIDLNQWTRQWLQTSGPNRVVFDYQCEGDKIKTAFIKQTQSVSKAFSPHRTKLSLFEVDEKEFDEIKTLDVTFSDGVTNVSEAIGLDCPDFILPNRDDKDFALYSLDKNSLTYAAQALVQLENPLSRYLIWNILNQMLRDGELSPGKFFEIAYQGLQTEKDDLLLGFLFGRRSFVKVSYELYMPSKLREEFAPKFEELLIKRISEAKTGSSLQMAFFDFMVSTASTKKTSEYLYQMLSSNTPPKGITLDQDRRWAIIIALSSAGHPKAIQLKDAELVRDGSTLGKRMAFAAKAAWPEIKSKKMVWKEFFNSKELTYSNFNEAAQYIHSLEVPELSKPFIDNYFNKITSMNWASHDDIVDIYFERLFPVQLCSKDIEDQSLSRMRSARNLTSLAKRSWLEAHDELSRCVRVRK
jgi:aminopeptidase N